MATTAPTNPQLTINVTNNGAGTNTISDTLNGSAVTYGLTIVGTGNSLTNSVAATGAVALNQTITGSNNTVGNTVSGVASFTHNLAITGSGNTIANTANGGGAKTIGQTITGSNNLVTVGLTGAGTQSSSLTTDSGTKVNFTEASAANNSAAVVGLSNVIGAGGTAAKIILTQTALADNATANVNVSGGTFTMGTVNGNLEGIARISWHQPGGLRLPEQPQRHAQRRRDRRTRMAIPRSSSSNGRHRDREAGRPTTGCPAWHPPVRLVHCVVQRGLPRSGHLWLDRGNPLYITTRRESGM